MSPSLIASSAHPPSPTRRAAGRRHRLVSALAVGALLALGGIASVASAPIASAHDELTGTTPADTSTVATVPDSVVLHFTEPPVTVGLAVRVTGPAGDVQEGAAAINGKDVVQPLKPSAPAGAYRVAWRVTADDGHASSGELTFTATATAASARVATSTPGADAQTATTTPPTEATPAASTTSSDTSPVAIAAIVVVLVLLAGLALVLTRRSRGDQSRS